MNLKHLLYSFACLAFSIVIGGAVYEHMVIVPKWSAAPPASLSMMQGKYGLQSELFWMSIHPVTILLLVLTLAFAWKTLARKNVLITVIGYVLILAITATYFVPELLDILGAPFSDTIDESLTKRAKQWEMLSIVRLFVLIVLVTILTLGLTKVDTKRTA